MRMTYCCVYARNVLPEEYVCCGLPWNRDREIRWQNQLFLLQRCITEIIRRTNYQPNQIEVFMASENVDALDNMTPEDLADAWELMKCPYWLNIETPTFGKGVFS